MRFGFRTVQMDSIVEFDAIGSIRGSHAGHLTSLKLPIYTGCPITAGDRVLICHLTFWLVIDNGENQCTLHTHYGVN